MSVFVQIVTVPRKSMEGSYLVLNFLEGSETLFKSTAFNFLSGMNARLRAARVGYFL